MRSIISLVVQRKYTFIAVALVGLYCLLCTISVIHSERLSKALLFGPHDSTYYLSFAARAFNPSLGTTILGFSGGQNLFLMGGADGASGIHKGLHFEPLKYLTALAHLLTPSPNTIALVHALLFFLPLLYVAWLLCKRAITDPVLLTLLVLLYAFSPNIFYLVNDQFRPFVLLYPSFFLFLLSIVFRRPLSEKMLFLALLLFSREEGLVLALLGIVYEHFCEWKGRLVHTTSRALLILWTVAAVVIGIYFVWVAPAYTFNNNATLASVISMGIDRGHIDRFTLLASILGIACVLVAASTRFFRGSVRRIIIMVLLVAVCMNGYHTAVFSSAILNNASWDRSQLVFSARAYVDRDAYVLTDANTVNAFYDFKNVIVLDQVPSRDVVRMEEYYPHNHEYLKGLFAGSLEYIVVNEVNRKIIHDLVSEAGRMLEVLEEDEHHSFFRVR